MATTSSSSLNSDNATVGNQNNSNQNVTGKWMDVHGSGVFPTCSDDSLYPAIHNKLFKKDKRSISEWAETGNDKSDLMGFTINPSKAGVMYSGGHLKLVETWALEQALTMA